MSKEAPSTGEFVTRMSLVAVLGLGLTATAATGCTPFDKRAATRATSSPTPAPSVMAEPTPACLLALEQFSIDLNLEAGGAYATNEGDCVNVFGSELGDTSGAVGRIAGGETFYIDCYDLAASGLRVNVRGSKGLLDLTGYAMQQLNEDPAARMVRTC